MPAPPIRELRAVRELDMALSTLRILLVEDDEVDIEFFLRTLQDEQREVTVVRNGAEALALLRAQTNPFRPPNPYIIVTDIQMPVMNGLEFLQELRQDPALERSIVFVLSNSTLTTDKLAAYEQHVAGYISKAKLKEQFPILIDLMQSYQNSVQFPPI